MIMFMRLLPILHTSEIGFMGKKWDKSGIAYDVEFWEECLRILKPGGYLASFSATSTYHRMASAIEDAGFEIRDQIQFFYDGNKDIENFMETLNEEQKRAFIHLFDQQGFLGMHNWIYAQGMPKGQNIGKAIQKLSNKKETSSNYSSEFLSEKISEYDGYFTTLKPANEPICIARKPFSHSSVTECILEHGTGAFHIDACRIPRGKDDRFEYGVTGNQKATTGKYGIYGHFEPTSYTPHEQGRYPSNIVFDVTTSKVLEQQAKDASRFFFCAKATKKERGSYNTHPTVKSVELMRWLVRLLTPNNGIILDPFAGSGSTLLASQAEGVCAIGIEKEAEYVEIIKKRLHVKST